ncbi:MAG: sensor histidine kinase [Vicinamibacterales bacterium]
MPTSNADPLAARSTTSVPGTAGEHRHLDQPELPASQILALGVPAAIVVALSVTAQTYLSMLGHGHSFWRILCWQMSVFGVWVFMAPPLARLGAGLQGGLRQLGRSSWLRVAAAGTLSISLHIVVTAYLAAWLRPFTPVVVTDPGQLLRSQFESQFATDLLVFTMLLVVGRTVAVGHRARQLALRESRLEADLARAHLEALRLEIQPHFLFNILNSIAALIRTNANDKALGMLIGLGDLMRSTLERPPDQLTSFGTEVEFVRRYLDLQHARLGDRLEVRYALAPESFDLAVPTFLLQPLVENALRHGAGQTVGLCTIAIASSVRDSVLRVEVLDDGAGLPAGFSLARDAGTGLRNIELRLSQLYGPAANLSLTARDGGGTVATVLIPASVVQRTRT